MIRHAPVVALAIVLMPVVLAGQTTTLTIEASSTNVHEFPTANSRVIGQVHQGRVLDVIRDEGDWVTVVWPETSASVGYVRLRVGSLASTETSDESWVSHVRADVNAVEQAIFAIWAGRSDSTAPFRKEASR